MGEASLGGGGRGLERAASILARFVRYPCDTTHRSAGHDSNRQPFALREKPEVIRCHRRVTLARIGPLPPIQSSINSLDLRNFFAGQHTSEISTARTVEKALYARHLLLSGRQVPEVYATEVARENADASMACCRRRRIEPSCRRQIEPTFKA